MDKENTPRNIDVSWEKWAKEMYDGTIMVNQVWVAYMEKGANQTDCTQARLDADKSGCVLADLEERTTYLVKLCPLYEYTFQGKTKYVSGDWTPVMEVKTGGPLPEIGTVIATDAGTGEFVWSCFAPGGDLFQMDSSAEVGLDSGQYSLQGDLDLVFFDAYTGEVLWRLEGQIEWGLSAPLMRTGISISRSLIIEISPEGEVPHTLHTDQLGYGDTFWPTEMKVADPGRSLSGDTYEGYGYAINDLTPWCESDTAVTSVVIEPGVTGIGRYAFYECRGVADVYDSGNENQWAELSAEAAVEATAVIHFK